MFCSLFEMENYQGDLTDVVRASSSGGGPYTYGGCATGVSSDFSLDSTSGDRLWSHLPGDDSMNFGDPFSATRDPLLHHHHLQYLSASTFNFASSNSPELIGGGGGGSAAVSERPCNIFSRMLQISPNSKLGDGVTPCDSSAVGNSPSSTSTKPSAPTAAAATAMVRSSEGMININNGHGSNPVCLMDNSGMQISPPRNPAIKRRKSQVKKVVCIPAPAPANSRSSSSEVVPSDLWAWRKYGQKPIKGSPYPRGYYRCSSSKGCSARKQVERSRTDPNMLVITYTSEHNHPWPTQRNALAGSTRSHSSRNMTPTPTPAVGSSSASKPTAASVRRASPKDVHMASSPLTAAVKEESEEDQTSERADQEFPYELTLPVSNDCDDFFAEFAEMKAQDDEADPLNNLLLFTQSLVAGNDERSKGRKMASLDPFSELYDWAENNQFGNPNANSFKEAKGG